MAAAQQRLLRRRVISPPGRDVPDSERTLPERTMTPSGLIWRCRTRWLWAKLEALHEQSALDRLGYWMIRFRHV